MPTFPLSFRDGARWSTIGGASADV
jgi:hypothetical protein